MKHLLEHTKMQVLQELDTLRGPHVDNPRLEYAYEDLLDSIDRVIDHIEQEEQNAPWGDWGTGSTSFDNPIEQIKEEVRNVRETARRNREQQYGPRRDITDRPEPSTAPDEPQVDLDSPFERAGSGEFDHNQNQYGWDEMGRQANDQTDRHAMRDGSKESFEEMKENVENVTAADLDPDRLRELADIAEEAENGELDPQDLSNDEFQKILSRLRPDLVDWATGKSGFEQEFDQTEIVNTIREALHEAQQSSNGNIELLRTFQEHVSDSLFDLSHRKEKQNPNFRQAFEDIVNPSA